MANRTRAEYEARRLGRWMLVDVGRELRLARVSGGLRQRDVAERLGMSKGRVCLIEQGRLRTLNLPELARLGAAVGLKPSLRLYPLGRRLLDAPQLALLSRLRQRLHPSWAWATEVPVPIAGDLRAADCVLAIPNCRVLVEAYTRLADFQSQTAGAARKKRDLGADRLLLLLAASHANRRAAAEARAITTGSFPLGTRPALSALTEGRDPGADAIVFL